VLTALSLLFKCKDYGLLGCDALHLVGSYKHLEEPGVCVFYPEDGGTGSSTVLLPIYQTMQCNLLEDVILLFTAVRISSFMGY
jgi:hypothetical protein